MKMSDKELLIFGRRLNTDSMMYEFEDKSGISIPAELMLREGDYMIELFFLKDRLEHADG